MLSPVDIHVKFQKNEGLVMMFVNNNSLRGKDPQEGFNHNQVCASAGLLFGIASVLRAFEAADIKGNIHNLGEIVKRKI